MNSYGAKRGLQFVTNERTLGSHRVKRGLHFLQSKKASYEFPRDKNG